MNKFAIKHLPFYLVLFAAIIGAYQLVTRFPAQWDTTQNALNSLEQGSVDALHHGR